MRCAALILIGACWGVMAPARAEVKLTPRFSDGVVRQLEVAAVMDLSPREAVRVFPQRRWTSAQAWDWYKQQPWIVGFNYVPSTAANTTEFWSAETFDAKTMDRELGWGAGLGFNSCRVFVQYLVWKHDPAGLKQRLDQFLALAARHGLTTTPVLFDDCAFGDPPQTEPYLGQQRDPIPGMIAPSWTPSPGHKTLADRGAWPSLEQYIKDVVGAFGQDPRVLMWDLYNEPTRSLPLVEATFKWARAVNPSQPLTMGPFGGPAEISRRQLELSDVITFHYYGNNQGLRGQIANYKQHLRPVINTEWMARLQGSRWDTDLPLFQQEAVGCYSWGLVNGRTQCQFAWYHKRGTPEPKVWFHDLFHRDGTPYDPAEHDVIRKTTASKVIDWSAAENYRRVLRSQDVAEYSQAALALRKWMIANDPFRPRYHFTGPESWINDPNGPIYYQGRYHLFYQYNPMVDGRKSATCWGHAVSPDLVHWVDWPVAIWPDTPQDRAGVYSGNTFIDDPGDLCALYTGNVQGHGETYGILARSTNGFVTCTKKVVMDNQQRPNPQSPVHWDGQVWKEGNTWCQLIGGCTEGRGAAWLWKSSDLQQWTRQTDIAPTIRLSEFWELPYLIPLGDRHVLMVGAGNPYWVGTYDAKAMQFTPDRLSPRSMDNGNYYSFNPNLVDDRGPGGAPRRIMHGWATIGRTPTRTVPYWEHAHSIPRVLTLRDGRVWQEPIPELEALRADKQSFKNLVVTPDSSDSLPTVKGDSLEILATFKPATAQRCGIKVRSSAADPKLGVPVWFDARDLSFGAGKVSMASDLKPGDPVTLHIFVDRCMVEVYVNGNANTVAAFHDSAAQGVELFSAGGACTLATLEVWRMKSIWE